MSFSTSDRMEALSLLRAAGLVRREHGDEIDCECPNAKNGHTGGVDRRPSFGLNIETGEFFCFTCGIAGKGLRSLRDALDGRATSLRSGVAGNGKAARNGITLSDVASKWASASPPAAEVTALFNLKGIPHTALDFVRMTTVTPGFPLTVPLIAIDKLPSVEVVGLHTRNLGAVRDCRRWDADAIKDRDLVPLIGWPSLSSDFWVITEGLTQTLLLAAHFGAQNVIGLPGATNDSGFAERVVPRIAKHVAGREITIATDNDVNGHKAAALITAALLAAGAIVRRAYAEEHKDLCDFAAAGGNVRALVLGDTDRTESPSPLIKHRAEALRAHFRSLAASRPEPVSTGTVNGDALTGGGFPYGGVSVVFGAPGVGKSSYLYNSVAVPHARKGKPVLIVSSELSAPEIVARIACARQRGGG